jgi:thiosulfate/3-mercaptopyruvate sulfurtransferase
MIGIGTSRYKQAATASANAVRSACALAFLAALLVVLLPSAMAQSATLLPASHLISPAQLLKVLQSPGPKPRILSVGPRMLYQQAHIPQAEYAGPASEASGRELLRRQVQALPRTTWIVLYCGCCPWTHCPNVNPAYTELERMGFTNVKVLKIDHDFGTDWVYKGYPTVRGTR